MKPQIASMNGCAHVAPTCQLLWAIATLFLVIVSPNQAQDYAFVQNHRPLTSVSFIADVPASPVQNEEDEFLADSAPSEEISSSKMAGKPAGTLPCEEPGRFHKNDTIPSAPPTLMPSVEGEKSSSAQPDHFLMGEIQTVQRMIRLMELKEEIMLEKARFAQKLADLQKKIANQ